MSERSSDLPSYIGFSEPSAADFDPADGLAAVMGAQKTGALGKLDTRLASLSLGASADAQDSAVTPDGNYVVVDVTAADRDGAGLLPVLEAIGLTHGSSFGAVASGLLPVDAIEALAGLAEIAFAYAAMGATGAGRVTTQADIAERANLARSTYGVDGTGIKIGVISDSFNTSSNSDTMASDIASGDLPSQTSILQDFSGGTDEGRGMAQLIHDLAPGAAIQFATGFVGQAGFANNITALVNAGAKIIVDDLIYYAEPAFQDGVIAQAVDQAVAAGVAYFSSAGNNANQGYEHAFVDSGTAVTIAGYLEELHAFAAGQTTLQLTLGRATQLELQWSEPAASAGGPGAASDVDLFVFDTSNQLFSSVANNIGRDPFEIVSLSPGTYRVEIGLYSGAAPVDMKLIALDNSGRASFAAVANANDGSVFGHAAAAGAIGWGAAYYGDPPAYGTSPPVVEGFSSTGPTRVDFDKNGNRLATPVTRQSVAFTAADGGDTTFFGSDTDGTGFPNFYGTSAAAPDAAAVAALMLQANSALTPADIRTLLQASAIDMDNPDTTGFDTGYDKATGSGLIQADRAVQAALAGAKPPSTIPAFSTPEEWFQHGGGFIAGQAQYADINGDGKADLIFQGLDNKFWVSVSTGTGFSSTTEWFQHGGPGFMAGEAQYADINGDGNADLIYQGVDNRFWVSVSTGTGFSSTTEWARHGGPGFMAGEAQYADPNGDGNADLIYQGVDNRFWVSLSTGTGFAQGEIWATHGGPGFIAGEAQYADLNGDGKADLVYQGLDNRFWVSLSNGTSFAQGEIWATHGGPGFIAGEAQYADMNGDGRADLIYQGVDNRFWVSLSTGTGFAPGQAWAQVAAQLGNDFVAGQVHYGDVTGNGAADLIFRDNSNQVWVSASTGSSLLVPQQVAAFGGDFQPGQLATVDLSGDSLIDLMFQTSLNQFLASIDSGTPAPSAADAAQPRDGGPDPVVVDTAPNQFGLTPDHLQFG